jgi:hypothetical protein
MAKELVYCAVVVSEGGFTPGAGEFEQRGHFVPFRRLSFLSHDDFPVQFAIDHYVFGEAYDFAVPVFGLEPFECFVEVLYFPISSRDLELPDPFADGLVRRCWGWGSAWFGAAHEDYYGAEQTTQNNANNCLRSHGYNLRFVTSS